MSDHADLELIAAFREGMLDPAASERVGRHLEGCLICAQRRSALEDVTSVLAAAPTPPLPAQLARRLDAALAAEIAASAGQALRDAAGQTVPDAAGQTVPDAAGQTTAGTPGLAEPGTALGAARKRSRSRWADAARPPRRGLPAVLLRPLAAAAAVCLLAGGGYLLLHSNGPTGSSSSSAPISRPAKSSSGNPTSGPLNEPGAAAAAQGGAGRSLLLVSSGINYQPDQLRADAQRVLQRYESRFTGPERALHQPPQEPSGFPTAGCIQRVAGAAQPLIVDRAYYQGVRAAVIIQPAGSTTAGHVWVVGTACSDRAEDLLAQSGL